MACSHTASEKKRSQVLPALIQVKSPGGDAGAEGWSDLDESQATPYIGDVDAGLRDRALCAMGDSVTAALHGVAVSSAGRNSYSRPVRMIGAKIG